MSVNDSTHVDPIPPDRFQRAADLFDQARVLPPQKRKEFLKTRCAGDQRLEKEVQDLLGHHEDPHGLLEHPVALKSTFGRSMDMTNAEMSHPDRIGGYVIRELLGQGGMGIVYLAEQENPRRQVAIKVIRPALVDVESRQRFQLETALLGRLQHPGIAQIYEAGVHHDAVGDRPFFAMELVEGAPLVMHADRINASTQERLELFVRICDTVHYAHQKGVIHRDLKPGNILIAKADSESTPKVAGTLREPSAFREPSVSATPSSATSNRTGWMPKILDFGVARVVDSEPDLTSPQTRVGQFIGTLPYMSPEQIHGRSQEVDTRSDVYALGVIAFELLTGRLPYEFGKCSVFEAAAKITDQTPQSLSEVDRRFRGDLNKIVMQALARDADRRYQSANDLAADVRRYLNDQPIEARTPSTLYLLQKFTQRNKGLVAAMALAILTLVSGVIISAGFAAGKSRALKQSEIHLKKAEQEQEQAEQNFKEARAAIDQLTALSRELNQVPGTDEIRQKLLREVLDFYVSHVETSDDPEIVFEIANTWRRISSIRRTLGEYELAVVDFDRAKAMLQRLCDDHPVELKYRSALASCHFEIGATLQRLKKRPEAAESFLESANEYVACEAINPGGSYVRRRAGAINNATACFFEARMNDRAIELNQQAIELFESIPDLSSGSGFGYSLALEVRANWLRHNKKYSDAITLFEKALAIQLEILEKRQDQSGNPAYAARICSALAQSKIESGLPLDAWASDAELAIKLYGNRWQTRPDRPAAGFEFTRTARRFADEYWFQGRHQKAAGLYRQVGTTLADIDQRFPDFTFYQHGQKEIKYHRVMLYATCPFKSLRDEKAALKIAREMFEEQPDSSLARWAWLVTESLYGDGLMAELALDNSDWASKDWDMMKLIRMAISFRQDEAFDIESESTRANLILSRPRAITGYERPFAQRVFEIIER